jgi:hypothetical protein
MIETVKAGFYVSLDEPAATIPGVLDGTQGSVTSPSRSKTM